MALGATVYRFRIDLSDVDRGVYEALDLRVARHPSESMPYLLTRIFAYCLCHEEGIAFSRGGLSSTDEPPLSVRDAQGNLRVWIEVGTPSADRMHKASKAAPRLVVFTHNDPALLRRAARERDIHRVDAIEVYAVEAALLAALEPLVDRNSEWTVVRTEGMLYVTVGDAALSGTVTRVELGGG